MSNFHAKLSHSAAVDFQRPPDLLGLRAMVKCPPWGMDTWCFCLRIGWYPPCTPKSTGWASFSNDSVLPISGFCSALLDDFRVSDRMQCNAHVTVWSSHWYQYQAWQPSMCAKVISCIFKPSQSSWWHNYPKQRESKQKQPPWFQGRGEVTSTPQER